MKPTDPTSWTPSRSGPTSPCVLPASLPCGSAAFSAARPTQWSTFGSLFKGISDIRSLPSGSLRPAGSYATKRPKHQLARRIGSGAGIFPPPVTTGVRTQLERSRTHAVCVGRGAILLDWVIRGPKNAVNHLIEPQCRGLSLFGSLSRPIREKPRNAQVNRILLGSPAVWRAIRFRR